MNSFFSEDELGKIGFQSVGKNVLISRKASIYGEKDISIGNNVRIDDFCILSGRIEIASYVHIAAYSALYGGEKGICISDFDNISSRVSVYAISDDYSGLSMTNPMIPEKYKKTLSNRVVLKKHVIVGSGSVILPGVIIEEGCAIGALSLVNKSTKSWTIYAGIPNREIKARSDKLLALENSFLLEFCSSNHE